VTQRHSSHLRAVERGPAWLAARARNAVRYTTLLATVGGAVFVAALIALVLVPREARREARTAVPSASERVDTLPLAADAARAYREVAAAESAFVRARAAAAGTPTAPVDTFPLGLVARRDTLALAIAALSRLISRAENAPLPASYRALGQSPELRNERRVRVLLDSLADVERERDAFDNLGGVDPIYISLTAQVTAIGRAIEGIAEARRAQLRRELAVLQPPRPPPGPVGSLAEGDTVGTAARLRDARRGYGQALARLRAAHARNAEVDRRLARARELANVMAPPIALLAAALVLGAAAGFGVALLVEVERPRLADPKEAERVSGTRVLAVVHPRPPNAERSRRRSDAQLPSTIDVSTDTYRLLYYRFAAAGAAVPLLTVTGDEPEVVAAVATNLAVASALEGRSTLLVDGDLRDGAVSRVLQLAPEPGLAGIFDGTANWPEAVVTAPVGREEFLDVIPNGGRPHGAPSAELVEKVRRGLARLAARYDVTVLVAPPVDVEHGSSSILPCPDVLVCARVAETPLLRLVQAVERLRASGERVLGVVVWDADPPQLPTREELPARERTSVTPGTRGGARRGSLSGADR
jgi:Mrp family chromosome partitioning ATPase